MAKEIRIKRGLTLNLQGKAPETMLAPIAPSRSYAVVPQDYQGVPPKLLVHVGDYVKAGSPVMYHKRFPAMKFVSPVSGEVMAIRRGAKRRILSIDIRPDEGACTYEIYDTGGDIATIDAEQLKALLLASGMWGFVRQRPYDIVADPTIVPRDIFVTAHFTAPLQPRFESLLKGKEHELQTALTALSRLTSGKVYMGVEPGTMTTYKDVERVEVYGSHPAGLVGTLINKIAPLDKGETVWTLKASDLLVIGRFLLSGRTDFCRRVAVAGSDAAERGFVEILPGCHLKDTFGSRLCMHDEHERVIAGDVLSGRRITDEDPYLPIDTDLITVIPEGDDVNEFFGWATPGMSKLSASRTFFSWLMPKTKEYVLDARIKGGQRAMIMSNEYERVFALDICAEYLIKAVIAFDITRMELLGIYEVAPEDFALCEFVDTSKIDIQRIIRQGLDELYKEMN